MQRTNSSGYIMPADDDFASQASSRQGLNNETGHVETDRSVDFRRNYLKDDGQIVNSFARFSNHAGDYSDRQPATSAQTQAQILAIQRRGAEDLMLSSAQAMPEIAESMVSREEEEDEFNMNPHFERERVIQSEFQLVEPVMKKVGSTGPKPPNPEHPQKHQVQQTLESDAAFATNRTNKSILPAIDAPKIAGFTFEDSSNTEQDNSG